MCVIYLQVFMKALVKTPRSVSLVEEEHDRLGTGHSRNVVRMGRLLSFHHHTRALRSSQVPGQPQRSLPAFWFLQREQVS